MPARVAPIVDGDGDEGAVAPRFSHLSASDQAAFTQFVPDPLAPPDWLLELQGGVAVDADAFIGAAPAGATATAADMAASVTPPPVPPLLGLAKGGLHQVAAEDQLPPVTPPMDRTAAAGATVAARNSLMADPANWPKMQSSAWESLPGSPGLPNTEMERNKRV